ncbi:MAG: type IVB secretion system protein IcmQ [Gammaproteobacteria bacterium]|nr:type IVB secretion system protein IcmQ [Gammaproteobacteria bacterium]
MSNATKEQKDKILRLIQEAVKQDNELRAQFQVGEKFRFIRDRLHALLARVEENLNTLQKESEQKTVELLEDEALVYVYLFNAQGLILKTWQKMVNPSVFYEYSINRPIYSDKAAIESYIRSKTNKIQHAYLTVAVKKANILQPVEGAEPLKDPLGNPVVKVREGSLTFDKLVSFTHNNTEYLFSEGELIKKE